MSTILKIGIIILFLLSSFKMNLLLYIAIMPWELQLQTGLGTFFRIMQVIVILKLLIKFLILKQKILFKFENKFSFFIFFMISLYSFSALIIYKDFSGIYIVFSIIIFILFKHNNANNLKLYNWYVIFTLNAIFFGLITNNFLNSEVDGELAYRFMGTCEPNYMALYINIAISIVLFNFKKFNIIFSLFSLIILYLGLILTMSTTGILTNIIALILSIFIYIKKEKMAFSKLKKSTIVIILSILLLVIGSQLSVVDIAYKRIEFKIETLLSGNISEATTGRSDISVSYQEAFNNQTLINQLFGNIHPVSREYFNLPMFSHNTVIDLKSTFGLYGLFFILIFFIFKLIRSDYLIKILILILLISTTSISAYTLPIFFMLFFI